MHGCGKRGRVPLCVYMHSDCSKHHAANYHHHVDRENVSGKISAWYLVSVVYLCDLRLFHLHSQCLVFFHL